jgi:multidrug resistance efflux pump
MAEKKRKRKKFIKWLILAVIILGTFIFFVLKNKNESSDIYQYITENIAMQDFEDYVDASGTVVSDYSNTIKSEVSEDIIAINIKDGEFVEKDQVLLILDPSSYNNTILDAKNSLEMANLNLQNVKEPTDELFILRAEQSLTQSEQSLENLEIRLSRKYDSTLTTLNSVYLDFNDLLSNSKKILYLSDLYITYDEDDDDYALDNSDIWDVEVPDYWSNILLSDANFYSVNDKENLEKYIRNATLYYLKAKSIYSRNIDYYYNINTSSEREEIETLVSKTKEISDVIYDLIRSENILYDYWIDYNEEHLRTINYSLTNYNKLLSQITPTINAHVSTVNNLMYSDSENGIDNIKQSIESAKENIKIQKGNLEDLEEGSDYKDIRAQEINVTQATNKLNELYDNLDKYYIKAPNSGVVASIDVEAGDSITGNMDLLSIISNEKTVEALVNETYISKLEIGQKVEITFDIFIDTVFKGQVISVSKLPEAGYSDLTYYKVTTSITEESLLEKDLENYTKIREGMSADIKIIISKTKNLLLISSFALKEDETGFYVETLNSDKTTNKKYIEIGDYNDFYYEILSGLEVGDEIITRIINTTSDTTKNIMDMMQMGNTSSSSSKGMGKKPAVSANKSK